MNRNKEANYNVTFAEEEFFTNLKNMQMIMEKVKKKISTNWSLLGYVILKTKN